MFVFIFQRQILKSVRCFASYTHIYICATLVFFSLKLSLLCSAMVEEQYQEGALEINEKKRTKFFINDHEDIVVEILKRLDARSLGVAACVCRLWCIVARNDSLWEHLCFRHVSPPPSGLRLVIVALGGYRRLYMAVLSRLGRASPIVTKAAAAAPWTSNEFQLSLSLFCVDCYERLNDGVDGINGGDNEKVVVKSSEPSAASLMFLCKTMNV